MSAYLKSAGILLAAAAVLYGCSDDFGKQNGRAGKFITFSISEGAGTSDVDASADVEKSQKSVGGASDTNNNASSIPDEERAWVVELQERTPDGKPLYMHAFVEDGIENENFNADKQTRATTVTAANFYDSFKLYTFKHSDAWSSATSVDNYTTSSVTTADETISVTDAAGTSKKTWPSSDYLSFAAYAPASITYNDTNALTVNAGDNNKGLKITYKLSTDPDNHKDLVVATATDKTNDGNAVPLNFEHILTKVKFAIPDDVTFPGKITKVTFSGIHLDGTYDTETGEWTCGSNIGNVTREFSDTEDATDDDLSFMMIPQSRDKSNGNSSAKIAITYKDNHTGNEHTLSSLAYTNSSGSTSNSTWCFGSSSTVTQRSWPKGKTVTYTISTSNIMYYATSLTIDQSGYITPSNYNKNKEDAVSMYYRFNGGSLLDYDFKGLNLTFNVTSQTYASKKTASGGSFISSSKASKGSLPYTVKFATGDSYTNLTDDDWYSTDDFIKNEHMQSFTTTETSTAGVYSNAFKSIHSLISSTDTHAYTLQNAAVKGSADNPYDLSTGALVNSNGSINSANCYVVTSPGTYCLPLVYGNAIKGGSTNTSSGYSSIGGYSSPWISSAANAVIVWNDTGEESYIDVESAIKTYNGHNYLVFTMPKRYMRQGNALVAVRNSSGTILWSWHIWATDIFGGTDTNFPAVASGNYTVAPCNLGFCAAEAVTYGMKTGEKYIYVKFSQPSEYNGVTVNNPQTKVLRIELADRTIYYGNNCTYYQWGRKDPFAPGIGANAVAGTSTFQWGVEKGVYYNSDIFTPVSQVLISGKFYIKQIPLAFDTVMVASNVISEGIKNPTTFYKNYYIDGGHGKVNLWDAGCTAAQAYKTITRNSVTKTIYDPCPAGYCVPPVGAFNGFLTTGNAYSEISSGFNGSSSDLSTKITYTTSIFKAPEEMTNTKLSWTLGSAKFYMFGYRENAMYNNTTPYKYGLINFGTNGNGPSYCWYAAPMKNDGTTTSKTLAPALELDGSGKVTIINTFYNGGVFYPSIGFNVRPIKE